MRELPTRKIRTEVVWGAAVEVRRSRLSGQSMMVSIRRGYVAYVAGVCLRKKESLY